MSLSLTSVQEDLLHACMPRIRSAARAMVKRLGRGGPAMVDDLAQEGAIGLVSVLQDYDPHHASGASVWTFARCRVAGAMVDFVRRCGMVSCHFRRTLKTRVCNLEDVGAEAFAGQADRGLAAVEDADEVERLMRGLSKRERLCIEMEAEELGRAETAARIGVSKSRVGQLLQQAREHAKAVM